MTSKNQGFTLIELLVATALMIIIVGLIGFIFTTAERTRHRVLNEVDAFKRVRDLDDSLHRDLSQMIRFPRPDLPIAANQNFGFGLRFERKEFVLPQQDDANIKRKADFIQFVIKERKKGGGTKNVLVTYRLKGTKLKYNGETVPPVPTQSRNPWVIRRTQELDPVTWAKIGTPEERTIVKQVADLRFQWHDIKAGENVGRWTPTSGTTTYLSHDVTGSVNPTSSFQAGFDGNTFLKTAVIKDDILKLNGLKSAEGMSIGRLGPGDSVHLVHLPTTGEPVFASGRYPIRKIDKFDIHLGTHFPDETPLDKANDDVTNVQAVIHSYPRAIRVSVRFVGQDEKEGSYIGGQIGL